MPKKRAPKRKAESEYVDVVRKLEFMNDSNSFG